jgi:hypothetical protein
MGVRISGAAAGDHAQPHYCALLKLPLRQIDLRLDCPEHQPVSA